MLTTHSNDALSGEHERIDESYAQRDQPESLGQSDRLLALALAERPDSYPLLWRKARSSFWKADGCSDTSLKVQIAQAGSAAADLALRANPRGIEAHYYGALNIAMYAQAVGLLRALAERLEGKFLAQLDFVLEHEDSFYFYGPRVTKGRYYYALPWPKRDLSKSRAEYERTLALCPGSLRAYLYLADTLLAQKRKAEAESALRSAITGDLAYDPPEARRVAHRAAELLATLEK